jgi:hypothetical protein
VPDATIIDLNEQVSRLRKIAEVPPATGGDGPYMPDMDNDRIGKLEGVVDGLKTNQTITLSAIGLVSALLLALASYSLVKIDTLNNRVTELPAKISSDIRDITTTLSQAITASKQQPPQVIFMQAPPPPAVPDSTTKP